MLQANLPSVYTQLQNSAAQTARSAALPASQAFAQLSVGQAVTATIVSRLSAGLYLADIVGQRLEMTMPVSVIAGDSVSLRVLRMEPNPLFAFMRHEGHSGTSVEAVGYTSRETTPPRASAAQSGATQGRIAASPWSQELAQLVVDQTVTGTIIARMNSGLYLADVGGRQVQLAMPVDVAPGETLFLRVLQIEPEPALEFLGRAATAAPAPSLSQAAQLIQAVIAGATPTPIQSAGPLVEPSALTSPTGPEQLAGNLLRAIEESGMFYESHLAAWTQGQRQLTQLQREPQAKWTALQHLPSYPGLAAAEAGRHAEHGAPARIDRGDDAIPRSIELPEQARPLLRQQLETLETGKILWNGQIWPGQAAVIVIAEEPPQQREQDAQAPSWRTSVSLTLPKLGDMRADLALSGQTLTISIACDAKNSARMLQSELPGLGKSLRAAALEPRSLTVTGNA
jgi:hypothetical protein